MKTKKDFLSLFLILLLSLLAIRPFFKEGLFPSHDAGVYVLRSFQFDKALKDSQFPPRWAQDFNFSFGYPIFNFFYPLAYYLAAFFHAFGLSFTGGVKLLFLLSFLSSGVTMYFLSKEFLGKSGALVSALLYIYAPFHSVDLYVRGSLGELLVMAFLPLLLLGVYKRKFILSGGILALVILSHNILAMISFALLLGFMTMIFFLAKKERKSLFYGFVFTLCLGLSLSCFFWMPALLEKKYTLFDQLALEEFNFRDHFVYPLQLRYSPWGFGGSLKGPIDGMSFKPGKIHILLSLLGVLSIFRFTKQKILKKVGIFFVFLFLGATFLSLNLSQVLWENLPMLELVQFPWRFLNLTMFSMAFLGGAVVLLLRRVFKKKLFYLSVFFISFLIVVFNAGFFKAGPEKYKSDKDFLTDEEIFTGNSTYANELLPVWVKKMPTELPSNKVEVTEDKGAVSELEFKSNLIKARINLKVKTQVVINNFYFPGWQLFVDGKKRELEVLEPLGNIGTTLEKDSHLLELKLLPTAVQRLANLVTILSLVFLLCRKKSKF